MIRAGESAAGVGVIARSFPLRVGEAGALARYDCRGVGFEGATSLGGLREVPAQSVTDNLPCDASEKKLTSMQNGSSRGLSGRSGTPT